MRVGFAPPSYPYRTFSASLEDDEHFAMKPPDRLRHDTARPSAPRYVTCLGTEAPKIHDLLGPDQKSRHLPLHAKPDAVATLKLAQLFTLSMAADVRDKLARAVRWLQDPCLYEAIHKRFESTSSARRSPRKSTLRRADVEMLVAIHRFEVREDVKCAANVFTVVEAAKRRRRMIIEPLLNDVIDPSDFDKIELPTSARIREMANLPFFIQFDAKAFYDQLPLDKAVRGYFGVGDDMASSCLPMGFKPSCAVAQSIAEALLSFDSPNVMKACYIDNFFFAGRSKAEVIAAVRIFFARCNEAGVVLNSTTLSFENSFDALGEHFETGLPTRTAHNGNATVSLTATTMDKLRAAKSQLRRQDADLLSYRQIAAIFGIAFYAARVSDRPPTFAFAALRFYRELIAPCDTWSATAPRITGIARQELEAWLDMLLLNVPTELGTPKELEEDCVVYSDASAWGWGSCTVRDGRTRTTNAEWTMDEKLRDNLRSSVNAEPKALVNAVIAAARPGDRRIIVFTDHLPLVYAWQRGYGKALPYNHMVVCLKRALPNVRIELQFVPGASNPADRASRGFSCTPEEDQLAAFECRMG